MAESEEELKSLLMKVKVDIGSDLIFLGSKITMDGDYSYKMKRGLLLGGKAITNLDSVLKSRNIIL